MKILNRTNPLCLKFIPYHRTVSSAVFVSTACLFLFFQFFVNTTLYWTNRSLWRFSVHASYMLINIAVINLFFLTEYSLKEMLAITALLTLFYISHKNGASVNIVLSMALIFSGRHFDKNKFYKIIAIQYLVLIAFVALLYYCGILISSGNYRGDVLRLDLGFYHPGRLGSFMLGFCLCWIAWRFYSFRIFDYLLLAGCAVFLWVFPNSRAPACITGFMAVVVFLCHASKMQILRNILVRTALVFAYPIFCVLSFLGGWAYTPENEFLRKLDILLSGRLYYAHGFLVKTRLTLWGQKLKTINDRQSARTGKPREILDNQYIRFFLENGVITALVIIVMMVVLSYILLKTEQYNFLLIIAAFSIFLCMDQRYTRISMNTTLYTLTYLFEYRLFPVVEKKPEPDSA